jgi:hypothetical protein
VQMSTGSGYIPTTTSYIVTTVRLVAAEIMKQETLSN